MDFYAVLDQVVALLRSRRRVSYRALKRQFALDDELLADLRAELRYAHYPIEEDHDQGLVWTGETAPPSEHTPPPPRPETEHAPHAERPPAEPHTPEAERRQLTVLFCDLVDSTALASRLDPEDLREVVRAYQATCAAVVQRFDGYIAQYLGDGLLMYFGYPQAHEDDAQRAVRAGLGMVEALGTFNVRLAHERGFRLAIRVGIHTGLVVVGEIGGGGRHEQLALGDTPNVAARIQGLATPDTVVISAATHRLVEGVFAQEDLGPHTLKGVATPMPVYHILGQRTTRSRFDVTGTAGLIPLVGREREVGLLLGRWAQVQDGMGQVVVLSGEAGIGKSRLIQEVQAQIAAHSHTHLECRGSPYTQNSPWSPVIELWQRVLEFERDESPQDRLRKLEGFLARYPVVVPDVVPFLASLLSLPVPEGYPPLALAAARQRQQTLEAVLAVLLALAEQQPVLCIVEDLHWVDPSTLELLTRLIDQSATAKMFTLLTIRPEFRPPWTSRAHLTQLTLGRLPRPHVQQLVARVTGGKALPAEVLHPLVTQTDGVPLFVEELTKAVLESGILQEAQDHYELTGPLLPFAIPPTLHDSLMARLDRLVSAKGIAQLAATIGRQFPYELLQAVSQLDEATLQRELGRLVEAELVYQRGMGRQATYSFKHALIQEAAYQALLKPTRQQYHQAIARAVVERFPEIAQRQPEWVAQHYTEAGFHAQAIGYWQQAGQRANERSAHLEAISHLTKGLEVLTHLPDTPERIQHELTLQLAVGVPLLATRGFAAPEVERSYARARALCLQMGETPQLFSALSGLYGFYVARAEIQTARELAEQLLTLAQRQHDPAHLLKAHGVMAGSSTWLGAFAEARAHLEQEWALYDPRQHRTLTFLYGEDPGVVCLSHMAWVLWFLGYPDQALARMHEALTLAGALSHPLSQARALFWAARLHQSRQEVQAAHERVEALMGLASEQGFPYRLANGTMLRGWALVAQGQDEAGMAQIHQGLADYRATGAAHGLSHHLALLAEAYGTIGQPEEGLRALAEAQTAAHTSGERFYEAELYRLRGELLRQQTAPLEEVETCFHQALDVARRQEAKALELRAAMSLSRLWQQQGKRAEARQLLAPVYSWFTEGFDTADLQEAKALLEELS
jgi:TOMM system kinase/cyclase fusion protein